MHDIVHKTNQLLRNSHVALLIVRGQGPSYYDLMIGALDGGSPCHLSILRNANVACLCRLFKAMSPVDFKK